tara:strand:- start:607 stop:1359 length:753 start_codon:yes stop_codon:yes gene_type:complete
MVNLYRDLIDKRSTTELQKVGNMDVQNSRPVWLLTFIDLISLLLAFFIMMFSMSTIKVSAWDVFKGSLDNEKRLEASSFEGYKNSTPLDHRSTRYGLNLGYLRSLLESSLKKEKALENVVFTYTSNNLIISLPSILIFEKGGTALSDSGRKALFLIAETLSNFNNDISLVGHSDPTPMSVGAKYKNNWTLSLSRALSVGQALKSAGYRKNLKILSFADTKFKRNSLTAPIKLEHQLARRVDIMIHKDWQQ